MKKGIIIFSLFLLMSMLFSTSSLAQGIGGGTSGTASAVTIFTKIVTFGWLVDLGITTASVDPIEGFTRFLLFLVLCLLLFKGAKAIGMGDGISIAITIVFSLLTTIFIPGTILLAAATSYGTVFSVIMLGIPLALIVGGYFLLKDYPWPRAGLAALLWFVTNEMQKHMKAWIVSSHYGSVVTSVVNLLDWVVYAAIAFMVLSLLQGAGSLFSGRPAGEMDARGTVAQWWNKFQTKARRLETSDMNEYVEDRKEMKKIETSKKEVRKASTLVLAIQAAKKVTNATTASDVDKAVKAVRTSIEKAESEMGRVKSRTRRQQRKYHKAVDLLKEKKSELKDKQKDVDRIELLEKDILEKHKEVEVALKDALSAYDSKVAAPLVSFNTLMAAVTTWPKTFAVTSKIGIAVGELVTALATTGDLSKNVTKAEAAEAAAMADMSGVIVEIQELLKWTPNGSD
jgi:hypothetical protein